jgi:phosphoribosylanthranilate isomerase
MALMRIKICGVMNADDARRAADLGVDAVGLNFYSRSPRYISEQTAEQIVRQLPPFVEPVGLFVNEPLTEVIERVRRLGFLRTIQWHGDRPELPVQMPYHFIPSFPVKDRQGLTAVAEYVATCRASACLPAAIIIDGQRAGSYGGTGQAAPWELLADFRFEVPLILAGGLTAENVAEAIRLVRPFSVDVAGGVEVSPGRKDFEKMRRFVQAVRQAM